MEQATNLFLKGLQMDTHPMMQGNDSLTDALNATFITMNGNEVILQNDMGNRRVDNAYLPSGYQPVGMKEYGGIIYIAAYNPITNRSLIGSFPSPERRMGNEYPELSTIFDLSVNGNGYSFTSYLEKEINYLKEDVLLIPITNDTSLHSGDKFSVYSSDIWTLKDKLTNFDNIKRGKIDSPKNKQFTLSLGVLNSQNEFVDITESLERWDENGMIENFSNDSKLGRFNTGYFIANNAPNKIDTQSKNDAQLIQERLLMAVNTYAYKLVGPLYLKTQLNHIQSINYSIYGTKNEGSPLTADIELITRIEYNCPDNFDYSNDGDDIYYSYYTADNNKFNAYDLYDYDATKSGYTKKHIENFEITSNGYNKDTNLYWVETKAQYTISANSKNKNNETTLYKYLLAVPAITQNETTYYLKGLSKEGEIDINLLGSGQVTLNEWRFKNTENNKFISYGFEAYPKLNHTLQNLQFCFIRCDSSKQLFDEQNPGNKGISKKVEELLATRNWNQISNNLSFGTFLDIGVLKDYDSKNLQTNIMYNVAIRYDDFYDNKTHWKYLNTVLWYVTDSDLFNDFYFDKINYNDIDKIEINPTIKYVFEPIININQYDSSDSSGYLYSKNKQTEYLLTNRLKFTTTFTKNLSLDISKTPPENTITITKKNDGKMNITFPTNINDTDIKLIGDENIQQLNSDKFNKNANKSEQTNKIIYNTEINLFYLAKPSDLQSKFKSEHVFENFGDYLNRFDKDYWFKKPFVSIENYYELDGWFRYSNNVDSTGWAPRVGTGDTMEDENRLHRDDVNPKQYCLRKIYKQDNGYIKELNNQLILINGLNAFTESDLVFTTTYCSDWFLKSMKNSDGATRRRGIHVWMKYKENSETKWMYLCLVIISKIDSNDISKPFFSWNLGLNNSFCTFFKTKNYYSDFDKNKIKDDIEMYVYDNSQIDYIKDFIWNIPINVFYEIDLNINNKLDKSLQRVEFIVNNINNTNTITTSINGYNLELKSDLQKYNKFQDFVYNCLDEVSKATIPSYCEDVGIVNLESGHLYKKNGDTFTEVGSPNPGGTIPNFPCRLLTANDFNNAYRYLEEETKPWMHLDLLNIIGFNDFGVIDNS